MLRHYAIGTVDASYEVPPILRDFRDMHDAMRKDGLFETSWAFYAYKNASQLALLATSMALLFTSNGSYARLSAAAASGLGSASGARAWRLPLLIDGPSGASTGFVRSVGRTR